MLCSVIRRKFGEFSREPQNATRRVQSRWLAGEVGVQDQQITSSSSQPRQVTSDFGYRDANCSRFFWFGYHERSNPYLPSVLQLQVARDDLKRESDQSQWCGPTGEEGSAFWRHCNVELKNSNASGSPVVVIKDARLARYALVPSVGVWSRLRAAVFNEAYLRSNR